MIYNRITSNRLRAVSRGWLVLLAALAATGCSRSASLEAEAPVLSLAPSYAGAMPAGAASKAAFDQGDAVGVWAAVDGRELLASGNALDHQKFTAAADGVTFSASPAAYYPNERDAVRLYAYFPYQAGQNNPRQVAYVVPTDQSAADNLKQSDLCWGATQTTPSAAPVPLSFKHMLAKVELRLTLPAGVTVSRVVWPNAVINGTLNVETGVFAVGTTLQTLETTGLELIAPTQSLQRLELVASNGTTYPFQPPTPVALQAGYTHTLNLTLTQNGVVATAELSTPVTTTDWTAGAAQAAITQPVANSFTAHWLVPAAGYASATRAELSVKGPSGVGQTLTATNLTLQEGTALACTFSFDVAAQAVNLGYPYTIQSVSFYNGATLIQQCSSLKGVTVYKSGDYTLGIEQGNIIVLTAGVNNFTGGATTAGALPYTGPVGSNVFYLTYSNGAAGSACTSAAKIVLTIGGQAVTLSPYTMVGTVFSAVSASGVDLQAAAGTKPTNYPYSITQVQIQKSDGTVLDTKSYGATPLVVYNQGAVVVSVVK